MKHAMIQSLEPGECWHKIATYAADVAAALIDSPEYRTALVKCGFSPAVVLRVVEVTDE